MIASAGTNRTDSPTAAQHPGMTGTWMSRWGNLAYDVEADRAERPSLPGPTTLLPTRHHDVAGFAA